MKKLFIFMGSFLVLYILVEWVSGFVLTAMYTPSIIQGVQTGGSTVTQFGMSNGSIILPLLSAVGAYAIANKLGNNIRFSKVAS
ncbi:hypothetical protein [Alkalicoccobacillus murimartini]|uniref:Quinol-cytochrome oxidoreductase complex cytochrome b subunit n=1 Tax=Alkalicoccobacillus murimartini TaxID=171685 RepID=A0ABT9YIA9_9BACI|nr:hypothetical protein [Alkalicoccobacillus murimartini]MDQ0207589.1 quinol-cytochrome oxidoreductase complex cytochrome b subunit [Alkalicoccobacillus murimartini]